MTEQVEKIRLEVSHRLELWIWAIHITTIQLFILVHPPLTSDWMSLLKNLLTITNCIIIKKSLCQKNFFYSIEFCNKPLITPRRTSNSNKFCNNQDGAMRVCRLRFLINSGISQKLIFHNGVTPAF